MESNSKSNTLLIVDDDTDILATAKFVLRRHFKKVITLSDPSLIPSTLESEDVDTFLLDMNFTLGTNSGAEGFTWLQTILAIKPTASIVLMTAFGEVRAAVQSMKLGASDYVLKPWNNDDLVKSVVNASLYRRSQDTPNTDIGHTAESGQDESNLVCNSPAMKQVVQLLQQVGPTETNVLITGENGTGKDIVARELHRLSRRANKPFVTVDMGAISDSLIESELFGHKKGAFTGALGNRLGRFQAAAQGSLFLDEIGNASTFAQMKLLRAIEDARITPVGSDESIKTDIRIISATNMPLEKMMAQDRFRMDLYFRLKTVHIEIPPLRHRIEDIAPLTFFYINFFSEKYNVPQKIISAATLNQLENYDWPGNIRELRHAIEKAIVISKTIEIKAVDIIPGNGIRVSGKTIEPHTETQPLDDELSLLENEKAMIERALQKYTGNISKAAALLGITRTSLYRRIKKYDL